MDVKTRETWPDVLRGLGVFFVLLVHINFFASASLGYTPNWALTFKAAAAPFYLPSLFFISGYFVPISLRRGSCQFVWIKALTIAWPLILWNLINTARGMNIASLDDVLRVSYLWFLLYLFIYSLIAALTVRIPAWIIFAVSMMLPVFVHGPSFMDLDRVFSFAPYFFAGVCASRWRALITVWARSRLAWLLAIAGVGACIWSALPSVLTPPLVQILSLVAVAGGVVVSVWISGVALIARLCVWLGRHSLEFYVLHWQIGLLIAPLWPHFDNAPLAFSVIGITVGALSCAASWLFKKPWLRYAFSLRAYKEA